MRPSIWIAMAVSVLSAGCASGPPTPTTTTPSATAPVAAGLAATATPGTTPAPATDGEKAPPGYKLVKRNGETLYCQKVKDLGSSIAKEVCTTPEAYEEMVRRMDADRQNFRKNSTICSTGGCGGG